MRSIFPSSAAAVVLVLAMACERRESHPAPADQAAAQTTTPQASAQVVRSAASARDPCSLLEPKEVEAVTAALAGPPFHTREVSDLNEPDASGDTCVYETPDFRTLRVTVVWDDGATAFKATSLPGQLLNAGPQTQESKGARLLLPGNVEMEGEWDEATRMGCCQIFALRGDRMVTFDYRGWRDDSTHAVGLLNKALLRLDQPLPAPPSGEDAARKRAALRPAPRPVCSLVSRAEAEAILGPLLDEPHPASSDPNAACVYRFTQAASKDSEFKDAPDAFKSLVSGLTGGRTGKVQGPVATQITVTWRGGFRRLRESALVAGSVMSGNGLDGQIGMPRRTSGQVAAGAWDEAAQNGLAFIAVKKDVALEIDTEPMLAEEQVELRRRLVAKAMEKIDR